MEHPVYIFVQVRWNNLYNIFVQVRWNTLDKFPTSRLGRLRHCVTHRGNQTLYCTVLYCTVLYCTVLYCTVLYYVVLYSIQDPHHLGPAVRVRGRRQGPVRGQGGTVRVQSQGQDCNHASQAVSKVSLMGTKSSSRHLTSPILI